MLAVAAAALGALLATSPAGAGTLAFDRKLPGHFKTAECDNGAGAQARCFLVDVAGVVPGLGRTTVHERVLQSGDMDAYLCEPQVRYVTFTTPRGTIDFVAHGIDCPASREQNGGYRAVVVDWDAVGGTGLYAGVTGHGGASVRPDEDEVFIHYYGTIDVPGATFDVAAPQFVSRPRPVTVRSPRATSVRFAPPIARDGVDGAVAVSCSPRSGARFRPGRTVVRCEAVDSSGNLAAASFVVHVRKPGS